MGASPLGANEQTVYRQCHFHGAQLSNTDAGFTSRGPVMEVAFGGKPDPKHAKWVRPPRAINEFRGNDFRQAELIDCYFFSRNRS